MDVDVTKTPNHTECIRCGMCIRACPTNAVCFRYGFGNGKETTKKTTEQKSDSSVGMSMNDMLLNFAMPADSSNVNEELEEDNEE